MILPRLYKVNDAWRMDTTVRVHGADLPITVSPSKEEVALWEALHCEKVVIVFLNGVSLQVALLVTRWYTGGVVKSADPLGVEHME
jgi:hypothetical protein